MKKSEPKPLETNEKTSPSTLESETQSAKILERFRSYMESEGKAKTTINGYVRDVGKYLTFVETELKGDVNLLTDEYIVQFRNSMIQSDYSVNTINTKLNSLLFYNRNLISEKILKKIVVETSKYRVNAKTLAELKESNKEVQ